jgi:hypothetical protein
MRFVSVSHTVERVVLRMSMPLTTQRACMQRSGAEVEGEREVNLNRMLRARGRLRAMRGHADGVGCSGSLRMAVKEQRMWRLSSDWRSWRPPCYSYAPSCSRAPRAAVRDISITCSLPSMCRTRAGGCMPGDG